MKLLIVLLLLGLLVTLGFSQNPGESKDVSDAARSGLKMKPIQIEKDYYEQMLRNTEKKKMKTRTVHSGETAIIKDISKTSKKTKYHSTANPKPKQILKNNYSPNFGKDRVQYFSRIKTKNKLQRVDGYVQREEIKKITGHPQYDQEILIEALGNVRPIKATTGKVESRK